MIYRVFWVFACLFVFGCQSASIPECDPRNALLPSFIGQASMIDKQRDEAAGDRWFWCEYGLPKWAWPHVPIAQEPGVFRIVNLRDRLSAFQGIGTWIHITQAEIDQQILEDTKVSRNPAMYPNKVPKRDAAAKRAAAYRFIATLYRLGIIVRSVNSNSMGIYTLESEIAWDADHPNCIQREDGPGAEQDSYEDVGAPDPDIATPSAPAPIPQDPGGGDHL